MSLPLALCARSWNQRMRDDVGRLADCGTDWVTFNLCGDDPEASIDTLRWFSEEIIAR